MSLWFFEAEGSAFGFVFVVDFLQLTINDLGEFVCRWLINILINKLVVEMVFLLTNVCEANEEFGLDAHQFLGLMYCVDKLWFVELFTRHRYDAIDLRDHVYGR